MTTADRTDAGRSKRIVLLLATTLVACFVGSIYVLQGPSARNTSSDERSPLQRGNNEPVPSVSDALTPTAESSSSARDAIAGEETQPQEVCEPSVLEENSPFSEKYRHATIAELESRFRELQIAFDAEKRAAVARRFESGAFFSEPLSSDLQAATAAMDAASPPRQDEILAEEIFVPRDGSGAINRWTYLSRTEYPELHARRDELEFVRARIQAGH